MCSAAPEEPDGEPELGKWFIYGIKPVLAIITKIPSFTVTRSNTLDIDKSEQNDFYSFVFMPCIQYCSWTKWIALFSVWL